MQRGSNDADAKASRSPITSRDLLIAMLQSGATCDATGWLLMARQQHAGTRLGTVYRFLRKLERCGLAEVETMVHSRCRWRLKNLAPVPPTGELEDMLESLRMFLREMEAPGLAVAFSGESRLENNSRHVERAGANQGTSNWRLLQQIAVNLGCRLVTRHASPAY